MLEDTLERRRGSRARAARRARPLSPRDLDLPVADARLPLGARHRSAPGRPRDPASRLVPPRREAARRVRLVVRRRAGRGDEAVADRHRLRAERSHLGKNAVTVYEALEDAGLTAAAVNITCYRGRHEHRPTVPFLTRPAHGPSRFFFYNLFESDMTGAPLVGAQPAPRIDRRLRRRGRPLARDAGRLRLPRLLPLRLRLRLACAGARTRRTPRSRAATTPSATLIEAAGGPEEFLERYAVILCADHGQTTVSEVARLQDVFPDDARDRLEPRRDGVLDGDAGGAGRADWTGTTAVDVVLYREGEEAVARRDGEELRFTREAARAATPRSSTIRRGCERAWAALANPNAGELIVSAAAGWEFADLAGRHHSGGGSHGSLAGRRLGGADAHGRPRRAAAARSWR